MTSGLRRSSLLVTAAMAVCLTAAGPVHGALIIQHVGSNDPLSEGFGLWPFNGGISSAGLPDDNGVQAWQIANTTSPFQAVYIQSGGTGPYLAGGSGLTQAQIDDINANGFTMSWRARVVSGPVYDEAGSQQVSAAIAVAGFTNTRFDIALGLDGQGNTVALIPESIAQVGGGFAHDPFGSIFIVPGNDYHLYQMSYDPVSGTAALWIDGLLMVTGYPGSAVSGGVVQNNFGLAFGSVNLATVNFAEATLESGQLTAVPALGPLGVAALGATLLAVVCGVLGSVART